MEYAVHPRHLAQIRRGDAVQNRDIDAVFIGIGAALVVGVDAACFAKPVFGGVGVELLQRQVISAFQDVDPKKRGRYHNRAASAAERAIAAARGVQAVA